MFNCIFIFASKLTILSYNKTRASICQNQPQWWDLSLFFSSLPFPVFGQSLKIKQANTKHVIETISQLFLEQKSVWKLHQDLVAFCSTSQHCLFWNILKSTENLQLCITVYIPNTKFIDKYTKIQISAEMWGIVFLFAVQICVWDMTCVGGGFTPLSPLCCRSRISPSATTAAGWWSARSEALPTCSPLTHTEASPVSGPTCPHGWSIAWVASRRARGWRRSSRSWRPSREDAVAPCPACPAAPLAHLSMVNPLSSFLSIMRIIGIS